MSLNPLASRRKCFEGRWRHLLGIMGSVLGRRAHYCPVEAKCRALKSPQMRSCDSTRPDSGRMCGSVCLTLEPWLHTRGALAPTTAHLIQRPPPTGVRPYSLVGGGGARGGLQDRPRLLPPQLRLSLCLCRFNRFPWSASKKPGCPTNVEQGPVS